MKEVLGSITTMQAPKWDELFSVNLFVGNVIGAMVFQKGKGSHYLKPSTIVKIVAAERTYLKLEVAVFVHVSSFSTIAQLSHLFS